MLIHRGYDIQRGQGIGSFFSGLFRSFLPVAKYGFNVGKKILSHPVAQTITAKVVDAGKEALKNVATDVLVEGKSFSESAQDELNKAKKKLSDAIKGRGKRKRLTHKQSNHHTKKRKNQHYNLLDL